MASSLGLFQIRRQVIAGRTGSYSATQVVKTDTPVPGPSELLVEVRAAGVNFFDIYVRQGLAPAIQPPCVLGLECAGVVRQTGEEVAEFRHGDHVIVHCPQGGAFSDVVVADKSNAISIPEELNFDIAASVTVNYLTAYFALVEMGGLKTGCSVLIQSAAGGVGWAATQIAKMHENVTVLGIASKFKHPQITENGVDHAFTYDQNIKEEVLRVCPEGVSIVLESLAGSSFSTSQDLLSPLGKVVLIGAKNMIAGENRSLFNLFWTWWQTKNISPYSLIMGNKAVGGFNLNTFKEKCPQKFFEGWTKIVEYLKDSKIRPRIDSVYSFEELEDACRRMTERKNIGKIILRPNSGL